MDKNRIIKEYREFLMEDVMSSDDVNKIGNFLDINSKEKEILNKFSEIINEIKNVEIKLEDFSIKSSHLSNMKREYYVFLPPQLKKIHQKFLSVYNSLLDEGTNKELLNVIIKKFLIDFKEDLDEIDSEKLNYYLENSKIDESIVNSSIFIQIEEFTFNRIHMPYGVPKYMRGLNLGEYIYLTVCKKINYISTDNTSFRHTNIMEPKRYNLQPSKGAKSVWLKLVQNPLVYTIMEKEQIMCISVDTKFSKIIDLIKEWFKDDIIKIKKGNSSTRPYNKPYFIDKDLCPKLLEFDDNQINILIKNSQHERN